MRFYFVRHGESEANVTREFSNDNRVKHPLTANGRAQAQALAEQLRATEFAALYASPLLRARQTAEILNAPHGLEIQIANLDARIDGGESFNELRARFMPFMQRLTEQYQDTDAQVLLVAHGGVFLLMLPLLLTNVGYAFARTHILRNAALVAAEQRAEGLVCVSWDGVQLTPMGSIVHET
ncbi:MAG: hypothetical protein DCC52_10270 [Chloroflexi bacterium]|nr:MAG: hypothetical protein DCC52_10270 [Chloroflexota bacterium]